MTDLVLLNPGPAATSERVRRALQRGDQCHRESEFAELLASVRDGLVKALVSPESHDPVVITGSGTSAVEMALLSSVRPGRAVLVLNNGAYGDRIHRMSLAHGFTTYEVRAEWDRPVEPARVEEVLAAHKDIDVVAGVMHETTSGLLNPVQEIGAIVAASRAVFLVDAISATGHEEPALTAVQADFICGTANKGLHGLPGAAFVLVSRNKGVLRMRDVPARSTYFDLSGHLTAQRERTVLYTPAIQVYHALDEAIKEFREQGGHRARSAEYRARAELLRDELTQLGLDILVPEPYRSNSVTAVRLPDGWTYDLLHDAMKKRGFVIYPAQERLAGDYFRVCNMGQLSLLDLSRFVSELADLLSSQKGE